MDTHTLRVVLISAAVSGAMLLVAFLYVRSLVPKEILDNWAEIKQHMENAEWVDEKIKQLKKNPWFSWATK